MTCTSTLKWTVFYSHGKFVNHSTRSVTTPPDPTPHQQATSDYLIPISVRRPSHIMHGFPEHCRQLLTDCRCYWNIRTQLSIEDDLILFGCRLLIPRDMRRDVLTQLHEAHQGMTHTKERARLVVYWPGLENDIENVILSCKTCQDVLPSNHREPIICKPRPDRPFQAIAADFCSYAGQEYLITVDCFINWPDIVLMGNNTTTLQLLSALKASFCRTGVPDQVWTNQGPQFTSKSFQEFPHQWAHHLFTPLPTE